MQKNVFLMMECLKLYNHNSSTALISSWVDGKHKSLQISMLWLQVYFKPLYHLEYISWTANLEEITVKSTFDFIFIF